MSTNRLVRRAGSAGVVLAAAGLALVLGGGTASAHVTAKVIGEPAEQGGFTKITFRVPNEDPTAGTVKLEIKLPAEHPMTSVRTKPTPGWTAAVTKAKLAKPITSNGTEITEAVSTITWTAHSGVRIGPGEFAEFEVGAGPLPESTDKLILPAVQTYDSGKVVSWDQAPPAEGAEEPEHPAPVVALAPAKKDGEAAPANASANGEQAQAGSSDAAVSSQDNTARWLGGAGLVVGALGLGVGAGATWRARRAVAVVRANAGVGDGS